MFLQSAGLQRRTVHALYEGDTVPDLTARQRALITFADRLTASPRDFSTEDLAGAREELADEGDFVEAVNVVAGFNFANRVADALNVPTEVPDVLERRRRTRLLMMDAMSWAMRKRMNFVDRAPGLSGGPQALADVEAALAQHGVSRPAFFERLLVRPHILRGQARMFESLLNLGFPKSQAVAIGYLTAELNGDVALAAAYRRALPGAEAAWCDRVARGQQPGNGVSEREQRVLQFARQVTVNAEGVTDADILGLREVGLVDRDILDLVLLTAGGNATNRLSLALSPRGK